MQVIIMQAQLQIIALWKLNSFKFFFFENIRIFCDKFVAAPIALHCDSYYNKCTKQVFHISRKVVPNLLKVSEHLPIFEKHYDSTVEI